jgi:hypothetical protein
LATAGPLSGTPRHPGLPSSTIAGTLRLDLGTLIDDRLIGNFRA